MGKTPALKIGRTVAFDVGLNLGWGSMGGGRPVESGTIRLRGGPREIGKTARHCGEFVYQIVETQKPDVIAFATPFIGIIRTKDEIVGGGRLRGKWQGINPDSLRPLFACLTKIEEICEELRIRCTEWDEPTARRAFMTGVPRKSADIKKAVMAGCSARGWPALTNHAADALCIASYAQGVLFGNAHLTAPLFMAPYLRKRGYRIKALGGER